VGSRNKHHIETSVYVNYWLVLDKRRLISQELCCTETIVWKIPLLKYLECLFREIRFSQHVSVLRTLLTLQDPPNTQCHMAEDSDPQQDSSEIKK